MKLIKTTLEGVVLLEPQVFGDHRGFFMESYSRKRWKEVLGTETDFVQDNHSFSSEVGTLRGLHYQLDPMAQMKVVRVVTGAIYDVVVDIRKGSPTFGKWVAETLTEENRRQMIVPRGFAHGFCTVAPNTHILYKTDNYYSPEHDRGIIWNDPDLGIPWPTRDPILSKKDEGLPRLSQAENNFTAGKGASK